MNKLLAVIPARGGSKGLPRKNLMVAGGRPLIAWTIEAARRAGSIDRVVVSSDDEEIIAVATSLGCEAPLRRPGVLATDSATSVDVVLHAMDHFSSFEYVVLLQPTSPLRISEDIDLAFDTLLTRRAYACVSVSLAEQSPYWMYTLGADDRLSSVVPGAPEVTRRQDLPEVYVLNGAIYIAQCDWLRSGRRFVDKDAVGYKMPRDRALDIDTADDFETFRRQVEARK
jgi:CMP-N,N'-diacetyllegionaminic acid synthase